MKSEEGGMTKEDTKEMINKAKSHFTMKDNRPRWVIYFDVILWIITLIAVGWWAYNYGWHFTEVNMYCQLDPMQAEQRIGGGKVLALNYSLFLNQEGWGVKNITEHPSGEDLTSEEAIERYG